jgi:hypothetical protein
MWDLPIALYPGAPPSWYRSGVSQLPTNPLTGINRDTNNPTTDKGLLKVTVYNGSRESRNQGAYLLIAITY